MLIYFLNYRSVKQTLIFLIIWLFISMYQNKIMRHIPVYVEKEKTRPYVKKEKIKNGAFMM